MLYGVPSHITTASVNYVARMKTATNRSYLRSVVTWKLHFMRVLLRNDYIHINNHNWISIVPYGRNFRGAGGRSDQCSVKAWLNRKVLSLDLIVTDSAVSDGDVYVVWCYLTSVCRQIIIQSAPKKSMRLYLTLIGHITKQRSSDVSRDTDMHITQAASRHSANTSLSTLLRLHGIHISMSHSTSDDICIMLCPLPIIITAWTSRLEKAIQPIYVC